MIDFAREVKSMVKSQKEAESARSCVAQFSR